MTDSFVNIYFEIMMLFLGAILGICLTKLVDWIIAKRSTKIRYKQLLSIITQEIDDLSFVVDNIVAVNIDELDEGMTEVWSKRFVMGKDNLVRMTGSYEEVLTLYKDIREAIEDIINRISHIQENLIILRQGVTSHNKQFIHNSIEKIKKENRYVLAIKNRWS